jgi:hypothetical protein
VKALASELDRIQKQLEEVEIPVEVLADFKTTVDHARLTLWGMLSKPEGDLRKGVALFRIRRIEEMCRQVGIDIEARDITAEIPALQELHAVLKDTLGRVSSLLKG